ncbi:hypothetical protein GE278_13990 [Enterobacteriaceae bacterium Kacie_13]|nr:hypothetical protein GE278_13990 [Enterobacteriaceae bacterium Kacie_13]
MNRIKWVLFLGLLASGMTQFATAGNTGTIHFSGAIVDGGCTFNTGSNQVISNCERGGKSVTQVRAVDTQNPQAFNLPLSLGTVTTQQINNDPHLAVMTVTYN